MLIKAKVVSGTTPIDATDEAIRLCRTRDHGSPYFQDITHHEDGKEVISIEFKLQGKNLRLDENSNLQAKLMQRLKLGRLPRLG